MGRVPAGAKQTSIVLGPQAQVSLERIMAEHGLNQRDAINWAINDAAGRLPVPGLRAIL